MGGVPEFEATLEAAQAGASWAVETIYRAHNPRILRFVRAREASEADDIVADAWVDVARNLSSFTGDEDAFRGWLFVIVRRRLVDHRRRRGRRPVDLADTTTLEGAATLSAEDEALQGRLGDEAAQRIVASLPPDQAEVVLLRVVGGLSADQVAQVTGRRAGSVRVLQHRALQRLARELGAGV